MVEVCLFIAPQSAADRLTSIGVRVALRSIGPGLVTQETVMCDTCAGTGSIYKDKDKCKKCKGKKVTSERKILEIYVPRGAK